MQYPIISFYFGVMEAGTLPTLNFVYDIDSHLLPFLHTNVPSYTERKLKLKLDDKHRNGRQKQGERERERERERNIKGTRDTEHDIHLQTLIKLIDLKGFNLHLAVKFKPATYLPTYLGKGFHRNRFICAHGSYLNEMISK